MSEFCHVKVEFAGQNGLTLEQAKAYAEHISMKAQVQAMLEHTDDNIVISFRCNNWIRDGKSMGKCLKSVLEEDGLKISSTQTKCITKEDINS